MADPNTRSAIADGIMGHPGQIHGVIHKAFRTTLVKIKTNDTIVNLTVYLFGIKSFFVGVDTAFTTCLSR